MFSKQSLPIAVTLVAVLCMTVPAALGEEAANARVSFDGGGGMVKGVADSDWSYATNNTLILADDTVWVDKGGTMEMEMSGGTFLRMADRSKAIIASLPPAAVIRLDTGSFYVQRVSRSSGAVTLRGPACSVEIQNDSMARIDILDSGSTTVSVHWGKATVHTDVGSPVVLNADRRCFIDPGYLPSKPVPFTADREDDFDAWNRERAKVLAGAVTDIAPMRSVINDAPIGAYDLAPYGQWVTVDNTPYWQPTVVVDYVPYRSGHWSYAPSYGYVWVGDYPFSYLTTHYGRWTYRDHYGWLWCYQNQWSPAWVASVRYGSDFLWCPLDPFNRPVCYDSNYLTIGGVRFSISACSYCPADSLFLGYAPVYGCGPNFGHGVSPTDIFQWDIYARGRRPGRHPFSIPNLPSRDYSPRRVIRGPDTIGPHHVLASQRISSLESIQNLAGRESGAITGHRGQRTATDQSIRTARTRNTSVDRSLLSTTSQLSARLRSPESGARNTDRMATRSSAPGVSIPATPTRTTGETATRDARNMPRTVTTPGLRNTTVGDATTAPRIAAGGRATEITPRRDSSRIVRLTNPSTARPPEGARSATVWPDKPLREDGNAVPTPRRTPTPTRIAEDQGSPLRTPNSALRYDGGATNRTQNDFRSPSADTPDPRRVEPSVTFDRTPAYHNEPTNRSQDSPTPQRFDRFSRQTETPTPQRIERQAPAIEAPQRFNNTPQRFDSAPQRFDSAPQRFDSAPRAVERQATPRFEAPSRTFEAPAPRFEAPRIESSRPSPVFTPPSRDTSTQNVLRGGSSGDNGDRGPSRSARGR